MYFDAVSKPSQARQMNRQQKKINNSGIKMPIQSVSQEIIQWFVAVAETSERKKTAKPPVQAENASRLNNHFTPPGTINRLSELLATDTTSIFAQRRPCRGPRIVTLFLTSALKTVNSQLGNRRPFVTRRSS
jgi:hypothetical protein